MFRFIAIVFSCFRTEVEYDIAKTTPIFKKSAPQRLDPDEYPHVHDQLRNHMVTSKFKTEIVHNSLKDVY